MSRAALNAGHQVESDLKKAQEISLEVRFPEISYQVHLQSAKLSHGLSAAEVKKHSIPAEDRLTQAKRSLEDVASQIEEQDDREAFLTTRMAESRSRGWGNWRPTYLQPRRFMVKLRLTLD